MRLYFEMLCYSFQLNYSLRSGESCKVNAKQIKSLPENIPLPILSSFLLFLILTPWGSFEMLTTLFRDKGSNLRRIMVADLSLECLLADDFRDIPKS